MQSRKEIINTSVTTSISSIHQSMPTDRCTSMQYPSSFSTSLYRGNRFGSLAMTATFCFKRPAAVTMVFTWILQLAIYIRHTSRSIPLQCRSFCFLSRPDDSISLLVRQRPKHIYLRRARNLLDMVCMLGRRSGIVSSSSAASATSDLPYRHILYLPPPHNGRNKQTCCVSQQHKASLPLKGAAHAISVPL